MPAPRRRDSNAASDSCEMVSVCGIHRMPEDRHLCREQLLWTHASRKISRPSTPPFTAYSPTIKVFMEKGTELSLSPNTAGLTLSYLPCCIFLPCGNGFGKGAPKCWPNDPHFNERLAFPLSMTHSLDLIRFAKMVLSRCF